MKKNFLISVLIISVLFLATSSLFIETVAGKTTPTPAEKKAPELDLIETIKTITNYVFYGLLLFATLMMIIGAFNFITAGGDPEKQGKARDAIIYAIIGIIVAILAKGIVLFLETTFKVV